MTDKKVSQLTELLTFAADDLFLVVDTSEASVADRSKYATFSNLFKHSNLGETGNNTHTQIDVHIADGSIHFAESTINHTNIQNIGTNTHAQLDALLAGGVITGATELTTGQDSAADLFLVWDVSDGVLKNIKSGNIYIPLNHITTGAPSVSSIRGIPFQTATGVGMQIDTTNLSYDATNLGLLFGASNALVNIFTADFRARANFITTSFFLAAMTFQFMENTASGPTLLLLKARGTAPSSPGTITNGDELGKIIFGGYSGGSFNTSAEIQVIHDATGANALLNVSGKMLFKVTGVGGGLQQPVVAMTIFQDRDIEIEDDLLVKGNLDCSLDITAVGDVAGVNIDASGDMGCVNLVASGDVDGVNITATGDVAGVDIMASGDLSGVGLFTTGTHRENKTIKTTNGGTYTATAADRNVIIDNASGGFTLTLPSAPADGTKLSVWAGSAISVGNTLVINRGGSDVFSGGGTTFNHTRAHALIDFIYSSSNTTWYRG